VLVNKSGRYLPSIQDIFFLEKRRRAALHYIKKKASIQDIEQLVFKIILDPRET